MLRIFILTFPFVVMAVLFYTGYIITGSHFAATVAMICMAIAAVILFRYNIFLHRAKKEREAAAQSDQNEPVSQEE